jgi:hypothetical protein
MSESVEINTDIVVECPHCNAPVLVEKLNCRIFRHGTLKTNNQQINPHASKDECDNLLINNMIYGCSKPFQIIVNENKEFVAIICEYI